jgi:hypothetical protein
MRPGIEALLCGIVAMFACAVAAGATLEAQPASQRCDPAPANRPAPPAAANDRLPDSQVASGSHDIAWAWLGSPTRRYDHDALGSTLHAGSLHALVRRPGGALLEVALQLPPTRVIEDRVPRVADLDGNGFDEIIVVESDLQLGASIVVYGVQAGSAKAPPALVERARSKFLGTAHRWLNPVGTADFDDDGYAEVVAVATPHISGLLTLYRYRPPLLEPVATRPGLANHRFGTAEQQLAAIVETKGQWPTVIVPAMGLRDLRALRLERGEWKEVAKPLPLPAPVQRITPLGSGVCVSMLDGAAVKVMLRD